MKTRDVEAIARDVKALPVDQKLVLALALLSEGRQEMALSVIESARLDLLKEKFFPAESNP